MDLAPLRWAVSGHTSRSYQGTQPANAEDVCASDAGKDSSLDAARASAAEDTPRDLGGGCNYPREALMIDYLNGVTQDISSRRVVPLVVGIVLSHQYGL